MTRVITGTLTSTVTLNSNSNPLTIENGGAIVASPLGVYGDASQSWYVANQGVISGGTTGIEFLNGGAVTNSSSAAITGSGGYGVEITGAAGTVLNAGSITGKLSGVFLEKGGYANNSGVITGLPGVGILGGAGTVVNTGTIRGTGYGVLLGAGGYVHNLGGVITASSAKSGIGTGVGILKGTGTVVNTGTIRGTNYGVLLGAGGNVINLGGFITASNATVGIGIHVGGQAGSVFNSGTVSGFQAGVFMTSGGYVVNSGSASSIIGTTNTGVYIAGGSATLLNNGLVQGGTGGALIAIGGGYLNNTGVLTGTGARSKGAYFGSVSSTVVNSGSIGAVQFGVALAAGGVVNNLAGGTIVGAAGGIYTSGYDGVVVQGGAGTVTNAGVIRGDSNGVYLLAGGVVNNSGSSSSIGGKLVGVYIHGGDGTVTTSGSIVGRYYAVKFSGSYNDRLVLDPGASLSGEVMGGSATNTLELAAGTAVGATGTLTNFSQQFDFFGTVSVDAGAGWAFASGVAIGSGVTLTDAGTLANAGSIATTVRLSAAGATLTNTGVISTSDYGVRSGVGGSLVNSGTISGAATHNVVFNQTTGAVTNSGVISGAGQAVLLNDGGSLGNSGTISGVNFGVVLEAAGTVQNSGLISAQGGVYITGGAGTVVDSGAISGSSTYAVQFVGAFNDRVKLIPGATFTGKVEGGSGVNTLELAGPGSGVLTNFSSEFVNFGAIDVDANANWTLSGAGETIAAALDIAGPLSVAESGGVTFSGDTTIEKSGTLAIVSGETLTTTGTSSVQGEVSGAGRWSLTAGTTTISGAKISVATWSLSGASVTLNQPSLIYSGAFSLSGGSTLTLLGALQLKSSATFSAAAVAGTQRLNLSGGGTISGALTFGSSGGIANFSTLTQIGAGALTLGDSSGAAVAFTNVANSVFAIADNNGVALGNSAASTISNLGTIEKTAGVGISVIAASVLGAGQVIVQTGAIEFTGASNAFSGALSGSGKIYFAGGNVTTFAPGATLSTAAVGILGSGTRLRVQTNLSYGGAFTLASGTSAALNSGVTLTLTGTSLLSGAISGLATLAMNGGSATFSATGIVTTSTWTTNGVALAFTGARGYAGAFTATAETLTLNALLNFTGQATFSDVTLQGAGQARFGKPTTISGGLTLGGSTTVENFTSLTQSGGDVVMGDSSNGTTEIINGGGATLWNITDDSGITTAGAGSASINNIGTIEKSGGTGVSVIAAAVSNNRAGKLEALSGTLDLQGAVSASGYDIVSGAATLEFDGAVASTQRVEFQGANSVLDLTNWGTFAGVVSDFDSNGASGDTIDVASPWTYVGFSASSDTLTFADGGTQHAVKLTGSFTASLFHASVVGGVTQVTYG